jgi:hypothetical protein
MKKCFNEIKDGVAMPEKKHKDCGHVHCLFLSVAK